MEVEQEFEDNLNGRRSSRLQLKSKRNYGSVSELDVNASSSDFQQLKQTDQSSFNSRPKRIDKKQNYAELHEDDLQIDDSQYIEEELSQSTGIFTPEIDQILWRKERMENNEEEQAVIIREYLVKYKDRSYIHTQWLSEEDILNSSKQGKQKLNRFNKTFERRLLEEEIDFDGTEIQYFDPQYTEVDRILSTTEVFPIIHPKKGSEIKGKWCESLVSVVSKLINFVKDNVRYGIYFMEPVNPEKDGCPNYKKIISNPMDLGTINNRLYLGYYKEVNQFWGDLGVVFKNCRKYNEDPISDIRRLSDTLAECAVELYNIWHEQQSEKYNSMLEQKRYNEDQEISSKINEQKLKEIKDELIGNKKLTIYHGIMKKITEEKMQVEENDLTPMIQLLKEDYQIEIDKDKIVPGNDLGDSLKQMLETVEIEIESILVEQRMQEFEMQMKQQDQNIEQWNPGQINFKWIEILDSQYLNEEDKQNLRNEVDKLYLVKWKHLSYSEATWEQESVIGCGNRILEYRAFNRSLDKETRQLMIHQNQRHKQLLDYELKKKKISQNTISELRNQLYFYEKQKSYPQLYTQRTQTIYKDRKLLRDYQLESLNWLIQSWYDNRNVILADEMGLGKTIQAISFLNHLYAFENSRGPFLVIAPLSTLEHWKRTVEEWTNLNSVLYYDNNGGEGRNICRYYEWNYTDISTKGAILQANDLYKFQILITSYEVFLLDVQNILTNVPFQFIVVDEAHRLKNQNGRILQALKKLPCKRILLLTGTPIQNNTEELFSLLNFIEPKEFFNIAEFKQQFGDLSTAEQIDKLNSKLKPYILRRQKEDVESMIPPLQETIIDIEMTRIQKTIYRALYERNKNMLLQGFSQSAASATQLNNLEMQLRKCCNHPFLIKEMQNELIKKCKDLKEYMDVLIESSGKMILVDKLLSKFKEEQKKVLIFSQFTYMLNILEEYLKYRAIKYEKIDGQIKARERQNAIDRFNDNTKNRKVFLLSTKAGGQGINLTAAEIVIIYDSDWNPQNDVQATARAHRIGQSKEVTVYRLVTKMTYEAEMFERATKKLGLDQAIFLGGHFKQTDIEDQSSKGKNKDKPEKKLSKTEIEILLKKGILGLVESERQQQIKENGEQEKQEFFEQDIDQILQNNSRMAKYSLINGSYTVSKRSFISEKSDNQLNLKDPNFWSIILQNTESKTQKLVNYFDENQIQLSQSVMDQKRFIFDVAECVNMIVESKLSNTNYNADDEKNITDILNKINFSKFILKQYKEMAMNWIYEIIKPSRRFKKIILQDLDLNQYNKQQSQQQQQYNNADYSNNNDNNQFTLQQQQNSNYTFIEGEDAKRLALKPKEELVKKLCFVCERSNCSYFCKGFCRRAFHEECKKYLEENPDWINIEGIDNQFIQKNEFWEFQQDDQELKAKLNIKYVCVDCNQNKILCYICKKKGNFYHSETWKKNKIEDEEIAMDDDDNNVKKSKNRINELSKCSTANCNRYFHLQCIREHPNAKMLEQSSTLFRCPAHICAYCRVNSSNTTTALIHCVRCCKSFHIKCAPYDVKNKIEKVGKKIMICDQCNKHKYQIKLSASDVFEPQQSTLIKIQLPNPKSLKQSKLSFKLNNQTEYNKKQHIAAQTNEDSDQFGTKDKTLRKRRRVDFSRSNSLERSQLAIKKKINKEKKKVEVQLLTYEDFNIIPVQQFDYTNYKSDWCRYCGARFASNFTKGPWGSRTLCTIHYINWGQKKTLDLSEYPELPSQPINREDQSELHFLQRQKAKDPLFDPRSLLENYNDDIYRLAEA